MSDDCARQMALITTVGRCLPVGSPMSPHLAGLVHLNLFGVAATTAKVAGNELRAWVDNITVLGNAPRRDIMGALKRAAASKGFLLHKIRRGGDRRRIELTGTSLSNGKVDVANASHLKIRDLLKQFRDEGDVFAKIALGNSLLGLIRHQKQVRRAAGERTERDKRASDE